jgi:hypothetical protein
MWRKQKHKLKQTENTMRTNYKTRSYVGSLLVSATVVAVALCWQSSVVRAQTATGTVSVASVIYGFDGKDLTTTVSVVDGTGAPVNNAAVTAELIEMKFNGAATGLRWYWSGTTSGNGTVGFVLSNVRKACYYTVVQNVQANGLVWDTITPANKFCR